MSHLGARAQPVDEDQASLFEVTRIRLGADGHIAAVWWCEAHADAAARKRPEVEATLTEVLDAIHSGARVVALFSGPGGPLPPRGFEAVEHVQGGESIVLSGPASAGRELKDLLPLDEPLDEPVVGTQVGRGRARTFAVSRVQLDADGRVLAVRWGPVNTETNQWAEPESTVPVAQAVQALHEGHRVFALFVAPHGHLPERKFAAVDYEDGRKTIVLQGPAIAGREIHDMDKL